MGVPHRVMPSVGRLIAAVFFIVFLPVLAHALSSTRVFDKVKNSVVVVKVLDPQGEVIGLGSGVMLPSGKIVTNCHVAKRGASYEVGRGKQLVSAFLDSEDLGKDICVLAGKRINGKPAQFGKAADLKVGDTVYAVGAPLGLELSISEGIVAQLRGGPPPLIQTTAAISFGSSGGGLFDREGRLVGLTTFQVRGGQSLNFALPVEWIGEVNAGRNLVAEGYDPSEWLKRAIALEKRKDWQGLLDWSLKWTKSEPKNALAWYYLGVVYDEFKRYNDAIDALRQTVRIDPGYANAWNNLGAAYVELKRYNDAIEALRQATRIDPQNANAWYNLGVAYDSLKRYNDAIEAYRQVLRINPKDDGVWNKLGVAYALSGNRTEALNVVRDLRRLDPVKAEKLLNQIERR
jgi:tetratricopeptide (TPR) repeat protein